MRLVPAIGVAFLVVLPAGRLHAHNPGSDEIEALTNQLKKTPDDLELLMRRARLFLAYGDLPDTMKDLNRIITLAPDHAEALVQRANVHYLKEQWEKALHDLSSAIAHENSEPSTLALRGKVLLNLKRPSKALEDLDRALAMKEYDVWLGDRAEAHEILGNIEEAIRDLERLITLTGGYFGYSDLARLRLKRGEAHLAIRVMDEAIGIDPKNPFTFLLRGEAKNMAGRDGAREDFREGLRLAGEITDPGRWGPSDHLLAARCLAGLERWTEALSAAESARSGGRDDPEVRDLIERIRLNIPKAPPGKDPAPSPAGVEEPGRSQNPPETEPERQEPERERRSSRGRVIIGLLAAVSGLSVLGVLAFLVVRKMSARIPGRAS